MSDHNPFGTLPDGRTVAEITLSAQGIRARVLALGAIIRTLEVETPSGWRNVVLGFGTLKPYLGESPYFGAIVGRCANRIRGGRFDLDGRSQTLALNDGGKVHLHGGEAGFDKRLWIVEAATSDSVTLALASPDGEEGYPGAVRARCTYRLSERRIAFDLSAETDAATLVNLAGHSYFNLEGEGSVRDHRLQVPADAYLPVDDALVPTGEIRPVEGTAFDFRSLRRMGEGADGVLFDHNFVLGMERTDAPRLVARVEGARSGIALEVHSTEPGLQVYDGNMLETDTPTLTGRPAVKHDGLCLEPQLFPDAIHHPAWASPVLRPGEIYRQTTEYRFETGL